jgi:hypothetical protein
MLFVENLTRLTANADGDKGGRTSVTAKDELLNQAVREYNAFEAAIHGLNEVQLTEVWLGTWSIREIVAHMSGWHREMGPALGRIARGAKPLLDGVSYDEVEAWNARFVAAKQAWPLDEVLLELDRSHEYFMHMAAGVPDERVQPGRTAYRIIDLNSAHHYHAHGEQIRTWRAARDL